MINQKLAKKIRRYVRLRGANDPRLNEKVFKKAYERSSPQLRQHHEKEMDDYFIAIEEKRVIPGNSILTAAFEEPGTVRHEDDE